MRKIKYLGEKFHRGHRGIRAFYIGIEYPKNKNSTEIMAKLFISHTHTFCSPIEFSSLFQTSLMIDIDSCDQGITRIRGTLIYL